MDELSKYEAEMQRLQGRPLGVPMGLGNRPAPPLLGSLAAGPPMPIEGQISELCQQVAEAGLRLANARYEYQQANQQREACEKVFAQVTDALLNSIQQLRESTPENVPYPQ